MASQEELSVKMCLRCPDEGICNLREMDASVCKDWFDHSGMIAKL